MDNKRNWLVLFIGGASGTGKSTLAYEIGKFYGINVIEVDDIGQALKVSTTKDTFPNIHFWSGGTNWKDIGVEGCKNWLINESKEYNFPLKAIVNRHIEDNVPIIIEGDFLNPEFTGSFNNITVESIFVIESNKEQIIENFLKREGGNPQEYRAEISIAYGNWLKNECEKENIIFIKSRPWNNLLERVIKIV